MAQPVKLTRHLPLLLSVIATVAALFWARHLELSPDVADLLPDVGEGRALRDYVRVFGRGDIGMVLVSGPDPDRVREATHHAVEALGETEQVRAVVDRVQFDVSQDPSMAWAMAGPTGRERLRQAVEPEGMRVRLQDSKRLLLTPGASHLAESLQRDPLRLRHVPFEDEVRLTGSARASSSHAFSPDLSGSLVADDGRARLILLSAKGQALRGSEARAFTSAVNNSLAVVRERHPDVRLELTGGHAIAAETEKLLRRDLLLSGLLSTLLVALAFALTFRRLRALLAVLPPLALGTLWTAAAAAIAFQRVSALTLGFIAVVVGVGLDTGVHVYSALLEGRRRGLSPADAAAQARRDTARPALVAAFTAAIAFATLAMSRVPALQQFGLLCAAGELLTALAILAITPAIGAWLERSTPPQPPRPAWVAWLDRGRKTQLAPLLLGMGAFVPVYVLFTLGLPGLGGALVAIQPAHLPSIETHQAIDEAFGGGGGQWVVMVRDQDEHRARARADMLFEALDQAPDQVASLDGLTRFAPSPETQRQRMRERDTLDLPARASTLRDALSETGFDPSAFSHALHSFSTPGTDAKDALATDSQSNRLFRARYLARSDGSGWASLYVRPRPGQEQALADRIRQVDPQAVITGYARLESVLADSVREDLPRVMWAAAMLVAAAILLTLRRLREGLVALGALAFGVLWVVALVRWWPLPIHIYNAFVLPVLLGITVDEVMFLLHRSRQEGMQRALETEGPVVLVTGVTTAAGFAALGICSFQGLRDMGVLGAAGAVFGLLAALWVVPVLGERYSTRRENRHGGFP